MKLQKIFVVFCLFGFINIFTTTNSLKKLATLSKTSLALEKNTIAVSNKINQTILKTDDPTKGGLFTEAKPVEACRATLLSKKTIHEGKEEFNEDQPFPKKKKNDMFNGDGNYLEMGMNNMAWFFDYLDDVLQKPMTDAFETCWNKAKEIKVTDQEVWNDPWSLNNLLHTYTDGQLGSPIGTKPSLSDDVMKKMIKPYLDVYNEPEFSMSLTIPQMQKLVTDWQWRKPMHLKNVNNWGKLMVIKYDVNGDGRLSPLEFLQAVVSENYDDFLTKDPERPNMYNCFTDIVSQKLDKMFYYMDCDGSGLISAENIFWSLTKLKREKKDQWNIYNCIISDKLQRYLHTTSVNDFVLKSMHLKDGLVSQLEWKKSILYGYINRQVLDTGILKDDSKNLKPLRWKDDGRKDVMCERVKELSK